MARANAARTRDVDGGSMPDSPMEDASASGSIVVTGTGRVTVEPDVADLRLGVSIVRPSVDEARLEAAATMAGVLEAVTDAGSGAPTFGRRCCPSSRATTTAKAPHRR
jgi:uncharacterized protein YggE